MANLPDAVIKTMKKTADAFSLPNQAAKYLLELMDPQNKNLFDMLLTPENPALASKGVLPSQVARGVVDSLITKVCLQSIDMPMMSFETERVGNVSIITDVIYPEDITLTFIENELGTVRAWIDNWMRQIMYSSEDPTGGYATFNGLPTGHKPGWTFYDNQEQAKKKAIIIPQTKMGAPAGVWIEIRGLRFKSLDNQTFDHKDGDPLYITVTCSCDNIWFKSPL